MINYAHRGASEYAPENTMAAFEMGLAMGANGIETDVQRTRDGVLVLAHDPTLARVAGLDRRICDMDWQELREVDAGSFKGEAYRNERVVLLEDFLRRFDGMDLYLAIEIKQEGIEREMWAMIRRMIPCERVTVTSFMYESLLALTTQEPKPRLGYLAREYSPELLDRLKKDGIDEFCPKAEWLTEEMVKAARERGLGLRAWGVKNVELMRRMNELGVDGMTVNFPDELTALLMGK